MPVAVVTDTTGYLPAELLAEHAITEVPLYVRFDSGRVEKESDITDYSAFFEELRKAESLPSTSQPSVGDFVTAYETLLATGDEIVSIHISGGLSGTPDSARQAAQQLERDGKGGDRVHVIDSSTAAGGLGMVVMAAVAAARTGASASEVVERTEKARENLKMWFALDTLEFLKRGGRIGAASAWIGSTLKVKPILTVEREIAPVERVRTAARALERLVDYARQRHESGADGWVVQHTSAPDTAGKLAEHCREIFGCEPLYMGEIGPVISAHTGPGLLGIGSIPIP